MPASLDGSPFAGTARYYDRFRAPYAQAAFDFIVEAYDLSEGVRALDLGCGPGTIAIPLSYTVAGVVAVDPDADMIAEGRRLAASRGRQNIQWLQSRAEDISPGAGRFRVTTIGQSFHWMDRDEVLRKLAILIADGGGLAFVNPGKRRPQESWEPVANQIVAKFLGPRTRHPKSNPQEPEHEPALRRSEFFSKFTAHEFPSTITRDIDSIIGCVYSISSSARPLFGNNVKAFEAELSKALLSLNPAGVFNEHVRDRSRHRAQESPIGSGASRVAGVDNLPRPNGLSAAAHTLSFRTILRYDANKCSQPSRSKPTNATATSPVRTSLMMTRSP